MITKYRLVLECECEPCMQYLENAFSRVVDRHQLLIDTTREHHGQHVRGTEIRKRTRMWVWTDEDKEKPVTGEVRTNG